MARIDPYVGICPELTLDFTGVRNANSSFINALVAGLVEQHVVSVLQKVVFKGCSPAIQVLVEAEAVFWLCLDGLLEGDRHLDLMLPWKRCHQKPQTIKLALKTGHKRMARPERFELPTL